MVGSFDFIVVNLIFYSEKVPQFILDEAMQFLAEIPGNRLFSKRAAA